MSHLPWIQFYYGDFEQSVACLSLAARGAWMMILCQMWHENAHTLRGDDNYFCSIIRADKEETRAAISEIGKRKVANVSRNCHGVVTVTCRRRKKEINVKENTKLRKQKQRGHVKVTVKSRQSHGVESESEARSYISSSEEEEKKVPVDNSKSEPVITKLSFIFSNFNFPLSKSDGKEIAKLLFKQIEKKLSEQQMLEQLNNFFLYFKEKDPDRPLGKNNPRLSGIESKKHLWNLIFKWLEKAKV